MYTLIDEKGLYKLYKWNDLTPCSSALKNNHYDVFSTENNEYGETNGKFIETITLDEWHKKY